MPRPELQKDSPLRAATPDAAKAAPRNDPALSRSCLQFAPLDSVSSAQEPFPLRDRSSLCHHENKPREKCQRGNSPPGFRSSRARLGLDPIGRRAITTDRTASRTPKIARTLAWSPGVFFGPMLYSAWPGDNCAFGRTPWG